MQGLAICTQPQFYDSVLFMDEVAQSQREEAPVVWVTQPIRDELGFAALCLTLSGPCFWQGWSCESGSRTELLFVPTLWPCNSPPQETKSLDMRCKVRMPSCPHLLLLRK